MTSPGVLAGRTGQGGDRSGAPGGASRPRLGARTDGVLLATVLAGLVVRLWGLGSQSLWYDEWLTSEAVRGSLPDLLHHVADREGIPPTWFALQWAWVQVAGDGDLALRVLPALFGAATVPLAYAVAVELRAGRLAARVAAVLVAVSPMLVWYSQEARPYSLIAFFGALSTLFFVRVWQRDQRRDLVAWAAVAAVTVAVHWFAAFLVAAQGLALLARRPGTWRRLALAAVPSTLVLAALAPWAVEQHSHEANRLWISDFPLRARLEEAGRSALVGPSPFDDRLWLAVVAVVVVAAVLALRAGPETRRSVGLLAGMAGAAVIPPVVLDATGVAEVVVGRYLIAALVPVVVAVAIGLAAGPRAVGLPVAALAAAVSLVVVVSVARDPHLGKPDWAAVAGAAGDDAALVLNVHRTVASPLVRYADGTVPIEGEATAQVDEIAVVHARPTSVPCNYLVGRACALLFLGGPLPPEIAARVTLVERVELDQFVVERYRTTGGPITVTKADLVAPHQLADALVLVPG